MEHTTIRAGSERIASRIGWGSVADTIPESGAYAFYNDYFRDVRWMDTYEAYCDSANISILGKEEYNLIITK